MWIEGITVVRRGLRRTLEIGYWGKKRLSLVCDHSVCGLELGMWDTDRERGRVCVCDCNSNDYCCATDSPSVFFRLFLRRCFRCLLLAKSLSFKHISQAEQQEASLCVCVSCIMMSCSEPREHRHHNKTHNQHFWLSCLSPAQLQTHADMTNLLKTALTSQLASCYSDRQLIESDTSCQALTFVTNYFLIRSTGRALSDLAPHCWLTRKL